MNSLHSQPSGDHQELQEKPICLEPQKKGGAEDNRKRTESEYPFIATRPAHQHVEDIDESDLRHDQGNLVIHLAPVPAPIGVNRGMHDHLHVVDRFGNDFITQLTAAPDNLPNQKQQQKR